MGNDLGSLPSYCIFMFILFGYGLDHTLLFSVKEKSLETRKLRKLLEKEEEEEVQEDVQRDSKVVKEYMKKKLLKCKSRSCFYRLFMSDQDNH